MIDKKISPGNPTGKGGFGDHPEHRQPGGRRKNAERYNYWLQFFKDLTIEEFKKYKTENPEMSMAALGAYARIAKTIDYLDEFKEVANRTEGMPKASVELSGEVKTALVRFIGEEEEKTDGDAS